MLGLEMRVTQIFLLLFHKSKNFPFDIYHIFCHEISCVTHTNLSVTETQVQDQLTDKIFNFVIKNLRQHPTLYWDAGESVFLCHYLTGIVA